VNFVAARAGFTAIVTGLGVAVGPAQALVSGKDVAGKVYEAVSLAAVLQAMHVIEGFQVALVGGTIVTLKRGVGPINAAYPHFELTKGGLHADVWTDVQVVGISSATIGQYAGNTHELDVAIVDHGTTQYPNPAQLWLGVECKYTPYGPNLLREILGVRRELSLLVPPTATKFDTWPMATVPADPPSALVVFSRDPSVVAYQPTGNFFGIAFKHLPA
jgi:hypothetical protein